MRQTDNPELSHETIQRIWAFPRELIRSPYSTASGSFRCLCSLFISSVRDDHMYFSGRECPDCWTEDADTNTTTARYGLTKHSREELLGARRRISAIMSLFGRVDHFFCWNCDVNVHLGGCNPAKRLGVVANRQGCFCECHLSGPH